MEPPSVYGALWAHNDWARDKVMALAANLDDESLDKSFAMGMGTLRLTLLHLWQAERAWLFCWQGDPDPPSPPPESGLPIPALWDRFRLTAAERQQFLDERRADGLAHTVHCTDPKGQVFEHGLGDLVLHVCNHGQHHRAQALNMLRHLGIEKLPGLDYLYMKVERPEPVPNFDPAVIGRWFDYSDWAMQRVLAVSSTLSDPQLDRPFEMGVGSLRKTIAHIREAEQWWLDNWTGDELVGYRELAAGLSVGQLGDLWQETVTGRNAFLAQQSAADLSRMVLAQVSETQSFRFAVGDCMLQLPGHGTHHRAQAVNMLRQLGAEVPAAGMVVWLREGEPIS